MEYFGFGSFISILGGAFFVCAVQDFTSEALSGAVLSIYALISGPFLLYGAVGFFQEMDSADKIPTEFAVAHYAGLVARRKFNLELVNCALVSVAAFFAFKLLRYIWKEIKAKKAGVGDPDLPHPTDVHEDKDS